MSIGVSIVNKSDTPNPAYSSDPKLTNPMDTPMHVSKWNLTFLRKRADRLLSRVAFRHYDEALIADMTMAGIEYVLKHPGEVYYQDIRTAMLDELFRWLFEVTAHQKKRTYTMIQYEDWMSRYSCTIRESVEQQVMARRCLYNVITGNLGKHKSKSRQAAIAAVCNTKTTRGKGTRAIFNARELIRKEIEREL